jgi:hypothetical protein
MLLRTFIFYCSFAIAGAATGLGSWYFQFNEFKAVKLIAIDRVDLPGLPTQYVIDPVILVEMIKSRGFAERVAERTGNAGMASQLPLSVRLLAGSPATAMELRLSMPTAELARATMNAVGDEIASIQSVKTEAFLNALKRSTPQPQPSASESRLTTGNEQAMLSQLDLTKALIETSIKVRSGQSAETSVSPPGSLRLLMAAGAIGMLCLAVVLRNFGMTFALMLVGPVSPSSVAETETPVEAIQASIALPILPDGMSQEANFTS